MATENPIVSSASLLASETESSAADPQLHDLLPFTIGSRTYAVFTEQVDGTAEGKPFAPLPRAPDAVIGVVCVRGRMLTVLDPSAILNHETPNWESPLPFVVVLRGDEQLALVAETCRDIITIAAADIEPTDGQAQTDVTLGLVKYAGEEMLILDSRRLFARAVQRRERRRRRF